MKNNHKKLIFLSFLFSISGLLLLYFQIDHLPIQKIVYPWLFLAFLAVLSFWIGEALCLRFLLQSLNCYIKITIALRSSLIGFFFSAVTPFSIGSVPAQLVFLENKGISLDKAIPALMMKTMINLFMRGSLSLLLLFLHPSLFSGRNSVLVQMVLIFYGSSILFTYFIVFHRSKRAIRYRIQFAQLCMRVSQKVAFFKIPLSKLSESVGQMQYSLLSYSHKANWLLKTSLVMFLSFSIQSTIPYWILLSFGVYASISTSVLMHSSYYLLQPLLPTPGGSGLAEMSFSAISMQYFGTASLWLVLLWRVFTYFLPMGIGFLLLLASISKSNK
jgi:glycosyltransferase 2 family protein